MESVFNPTETPTPTPTETPTDPRALLAAAGIATTGPTRIERDGVHRTASDEPTPEDHAHLTPAQIEEGWFVEHGRPHRPLEMAEDREHRWVVRGLARVVERHAARGDQVLLVWIRARRQIEEREVICYGGSFDLPGGHRGMYVYVKPTAPTPRHLFPRDGYIARACAQCGVARRVLEELTDVHGRVGEVCVVCTNNLREFDFDVPRPLMPRPAPTRRRRAA